MIYLKAHSPKIGILRILIGQFVKHFESAPCYFKYAIPVARCPKKICNIHEKFEVSFKIKGYLCFM